jgi:hypothetical protein
MLARTIAGLDPEQSSAGRPNWTCIFGFASDEQKRRGNIEAHRGMAGSDPSQRLGKFWE